MKTQLISSLKTVLEDRTVMVVLGIFLAGCLGLLLYTLISVHPSELQVVVHYTSFGSTNFYRDKWYYLLTFAFYVVLMATLHCALTYKILQAKGHTLAVSFASLGIIMVVIAFALFYQVLKIASLS